MIRLLSMGCISFGGEASFQLSFLAIVESTHTVSEGDADSEG
ncbi:hypothetical protein AM1_F0040 (plasmid) [Acaryochloris marina MBIC11017]|uniref:Uncharacterized protein n=1 Tax=Acaryochloris marina (strain MBIC 11017) TaxID=329726 RepID=A8ZQ24_ACAM1|nr:hypothetical protein AM1_F0040 [Acaryochloris marina MBIC11017]